MKNLKKQLLSAENKLKLLVSSENDPIKSEDITEYIEVEQILDRTDLTNLVFVESKSDFPEAVTIQAVVSLATNDYIEIWIENDTDNTDITVSYLNVIIEALN